MGLREQFHFRRRHAPHQVSSAQLRWMIEPGGGDHFRQGLECIAMEVEDALGFVRDYQRTLAQGVLSGDAGRAFVGVATLRLDAAYRYGPQNSTIAL